MLNRFFISNIKPSLFGAFRPLSRIADGTSLKLKTPQSCPKCKTAISSYFFVCPRCSALGPPPPSAKMNPFELFHCLRGEPMKFGLDESKLASEYRDWMKQLHPDRVQGAGGSLEEVETATTHSSLLRDAFNQLSDPVSRAVALLKWAYDTDVLGEDSSIEDNNFLLEVIDATEEINEIQDPQRAVEMKTEWTEAMQSILDQIASLFTALESSASTKIEDAISINRLDNLDSELQKCRVIQKLIARIDDKLIALTKTV